MKQIENRLSGQSSPYLIQHQANPVAWQPWDELSLTVAEAQDKPILLSIGYSTCHWCHVMAGESFQDSDVAKIMNERFINIKVDREERPDLDEIYQTAHQLITGTTGGWPLTVFLCPKTRLPFIAGTYFPKISNHGRVSFHDLLLRVDELYHKRGGEFANMREKVRHGYLQLAMAASSSGIHKLNREPINSAVERLLDTITPIYGGFGQAPKFVLPYNLERLFWAFKYDSNPLFAPAYEALRLTLSNMATSGICDVVNGGFFRYAVDDQWMIPHFEKMMYDNGPLLGLYARAAEVFTDPLFEDTARSIADWMVRDMQNRQGVFYTALDADSDDGEGRHYLWNRERIQQLLDPAEYAFVSAMYGLDGNPNFGELWHLHQVQSFVQVIQQLQLLPEEARALWHQARRKPRLERHRRNLRRDEKIICSINSIVIRGLAHAARILDESSYLKVAQRAVDFIRNHLWINSRLFSTWQVGQPKISGYLDDYAFLMDALLEMLEVEWRDRDYRLLIGLAESLLNNFEDREQGGFFFTAHDHETLIYRNKPMFDSVTPSGGGVAAKALGRLGHLAAEPRYLVAAERAVNNAWSSIVRQPETHNNFLLALEEILDGPVLVLLMGDDSMAEWQRHIKKEFHDKVLCYWVPEDSDLQPPEVSVMEPNQGLICVGERCLPVQDSLDQLTALLQQEFDNRHFTAPYLSNTNAQTEL